MKNTVITGITIYKPELEFCPVCNTKLIYKYATNNKKVQFRDGRTFKLKNLAYACENESCSCYNYKFTSQNVNRLCIKGCTYSIMLIWGLIYYNKILNYNLEQLNDKVLENKVAICDKNVMILIKKNYDLLNMDYKSNIKTIYKETIYKHNMMMLFTNVVLIENSYLYINVKNMFTNEDIGYHFIPCNDYRKVKEILENYIYPGLPLSYIFADESNFELMHVLKELMPSSTKVLSFKRYY